MEFKRFKVHQIAARIWAIQGPANDLMYLTVGRQRAMLVDTGMGIGNLPEVVRSLTGLPVLVVNTHGHPDHAGGNASFESVWMSPIDEVIRAKMCTNAYRRFDYQAAVGEGNPPSADFLQDFVPDRPYELIGLEPGHVFDLGDQHYEIIPVPGHTPGSVCLLNAKEKILFSGDTVVATPVWLYLDHSLPLAIYLDSLQRVWTREKEFDTLLPGHPPTPLGKEHLFDLILCVEEILAKPGVGELTTTFAGKGLLWKHGNATVIYSPDHLV